MQDVCESCKSGTHQLLTAEQVKLSALPKEYVGMCLCWNEVMLNTLGVAGPVTYCRCSFSTAQSTPQTCSCNLWAGCTCEVGRAQLKAERARKPKSNWSHYV